MKTEHKGMDSISSAAAIVMMVVKNKEKNAQVSNFLLTSKKPRQCKLNPSPSVATPLLGVNSQFKLKCIYECTLKSALLGFNMCDDEMRDWWQQLLANLSYSNASFPSGREKQGTVPVGQSFDAC